MKMFLSTKILNALRGAANQEGREQLFTSLIRRERDLTDRYGVPFAVLTFEAGKLSRREQKALNAYVADRFRETDELGAFSGKEAVLLRHTDAVTARKLEQAFLEGAEELGFDLVTQVLSYGEIVDQDNDEDDNDSTPNALESHLATPLGKVRRGVDIVASSAAILALSPVLAATALAIRLESPGSVFYFQQRGGFGGRPFSLIKFRSMRNDAEAMEASIRDENEKDGPIFKMKSDPRVTRIGRLIRRLSIDELPQLFNILKGDMTLIGPRPMKLDEVAAYESWQRRRLGVPGGLTCLWQVGGRSDLSFVEWMRLDCRYVQRRNMAMDIKILAKTPFAVLSGKGAY